MSRFPSKLSDNSFGKSVVATGDLSPGTPVERFRGEVRRYEELPEAEIIYVISFELDLWIIPEPNARFLNHSCDANCRFMDNGDVLTTREVGAGEELTIPYDFADRAHVESHPDHYFWDERWTFQCRCGSGHCRGVIDRYRPT